MRSISLVALLLCAAGALHLALRSPAPAPIRIGVIHALTGTMAISERPLVDAVRLAVGELNEAGGLLGRQVELLVADTRSDPAEAARAAQRLIAEERVSALFGCWTSACRKRVKPVVERHGNLLFYPVQYEGLEYSEQILYVGATANQQVIPGARWALDAFGRRVFLVGSDYVFPRTANLLIHDLVKASGGEVLAERYLPLGATDFAEIAHEIRRLRPDVVLNTLNGDSNNAFFRALVNGALDDLPVVSFSVAEGEMIVMGGAALRRHHAVWSYFQSLPGAPNDRFVSAFKQRFGADRFTSDPMEAAYVGVRLWAQAVRDAGDPAPARVNRTVVRQSLEAPSGLLSVDPATRHLWKPVRVGRVRPDGQFDVVFEAPDPLRPSPYPGYRTPAQWQAIVRHLEEAAP